MHVGIHHADHSFLILKDTDDHRHFTVPELLGRISSAVSGNDLVCTIRDGPYDQGIQDAVLFNTLHKHVHLVIGFYLERMSPEFPEPLHLDLNDPFLFPDPAVLLLHVCPPCLSQTREL